MIDVSRQINSIERRLGTRTVSAGEVRTLTVERVYATTPADLWEACTDPERLSRWFLPISGDLRVGGRYSFEGNASGTIERCEPPRSVDATWEWGGKVSWVELRLTPEPGGGTRFALAHLAHVDDDMWEQYGPGAVGIGWESGLLGLTLYVDGALPERAAIQAWQATDENRAFISASSERWAEASIAFGTDPEQARAAAQRTTDAYTG